MSSGSIIQRTTSTGGSRRIPVDAGKGRGGREHAHLFFPPVFRSVQDGKVLTGIIPRITIPVVDIFPVSFVDGSGFFHFSAGRVPSCPSFYLTGFPVVFTVFFGVISGVHGKFLSSAGSGVKSLFQHQTGYASAGIPCVCRIPSSNSPEYRI